MTSVFLLTAIASCAMSPARSGHNTSTPFVDLVIVRCGLQRAGGAYEIGAAATFESLSCNLPRSRHPDPLLPDILPSRFRKRVAGIDGVSGNRGCAGRVVPRSVPRHDQTASKRQHHRVGRTP